MEQRDRAYHRGTVWPWLIGPFIHAYLFAYGDSAEAPQFCRELLGRMEKEFYRCCLGSLSEVYDAEPPHRPGGCPAQLWSVAQFYLAWQRVNSTSRFHGEERMMAQNE
jgi:glycogen debranching enzyme